MDPARVCTSKFRDSRWFKRGWTLQELLAPAVVIFLDQDWIELGTKLSLQEEVCHATGISTHHLHQPRDASVAQKMSWASTRATTRSEDLAYCLLGVFDVNMPLLYGEGMKAFQRLQEEILKHSTDESLFAWANRGYNVSGLLAESPQDFRHSGNIVPEKLLKLPRKPYSNTNLGLAITMNYVTFDTLGSLGVVEGSSSLDQGFNHLRREMRAALLGCVDVTTNSRVVIWLTDDRWLDLDDSDDNDGRVKRINLGDLIFLDDRIVKELSVHGQNKILTASFFVDPRFVAGDSAEFGSLARSATLPWATRLQPDLLIMRRSSPIHGQLVPVETKLLDNSRRDSLQQGVEINGQMVYDLQRVNARTTICSSFHCPTLGKDILLRWNALGFKPREPCPETQVQVSDNSTMYKDSELILLSGDGSSIEIEIEPGYFLWVSLRSGGTAFQTRGPGQLRFSSIVSIDISDRSRSSILLPQ